MHQLTNEHGNPQVRHRPSPQKCHLFRHHLIPATIDVGAGNCLSSHDTTTWHCPSSGSNQLVPRVHHLSLPLTPSSGRYILVPFPRPVPGTTTRPLSLGLNKGHPHSEDNLDKLQHVKNTLARVVMATCRRDHISPVLADPHWLPIRAKITYKITTLVFKIREVKQPMYLAKLIEDYKPVRELRSTSRLLLKEPRFKTTTGQRSFHFASAKIWKGLPDHIRSINSFETFRKLLKTQLTHCHIAASLYFFFTLMNNNLATYGVVKIEFTYLQQVITT